MKQAASVNIYILARPFKRIVLRFRCGIAGRNSACNNWLCLYVHRARIGFVFLCLFRIFFLYCYLSLIYERERERAHRRAESSR